MPPTRGVLLSSARLKKKVVEVAETVVRACSEVVDYVARRFAKVVSVWTIGRLLKAAGFAWKRMRTSCKPQRDEQMFAFFKDELNQLKQMEDRGEIDLFFFDEAGFSLQPVVPYAWQRVGQTQIIPSRKGSNFTVIGLINRQGLLRYCLQAKAPKTQDIVDFFEALSPRKKTIIIMDQAPTHTANAFMERAQTWREKGLFIQLLPAASPELNYIEMLWKKIKYQWLPREAYTSAQSLHDHLHTILDLVGTKYQIHFA